MKPSKIAALLLTAFLAGCASRSNDLGTFHDPFSGLRTDIIIDNQLESGDQTREILWLNASRVFTDFSTYDYYLEATYAARPEVGYLDIGPGETLVIVADQKEMKFSGFGGRNMQKKKGGVLQENAIYRAQAADLRAIANAQHVTVRVIGKTGIVQREFGPANFERFKNFIKKYAASEP